MVPQSGSAVIFLQLNLIFETIYKRMLLFQITVCTLPATVVSMVRAWTRSVTVTTAGAARAAPCRTRTSANTGG